MIDTVADFKDGPAWDEYVRNHPQGRFSQLFGYTCIQRVYGYRPRYFGFTRAGKLIGVLPAFEARSLLFGRRLVSQPFSEYGGFLLDDNLSEDDVGHIMETLRRFVADARLPALELHGNQGMRRGEGGFVQDNPQHLATLDLRRPLEEIWSKTISRHVRKAVRKAEREGLTSREATSVETITERFYPLYVRSMRRLGSPPHSLSYFLECHRAFGGDMRIFWAMKDDLPIAGLLGFACGGRVSIVNIVSDERFWNLRPNDLIHWDFIGWAHRSGYRDFDFGSVRYEGQSQYKRKWGCDIEESGYYFLGADPSSPGQTTFDSSSSRLNFFRSAWSRLMPDPAARLIGPVLRKHLIR